MIGNLRIDLFVWWEKWVVEKEPVSPMDGLRVECVGNRHDNRKNTNTNNLFKLFIFVRLIENLIEK